MSRANAKLWSAVLNGDVRKVKRLLSAKPGSFEAASFDINETAGRDVRTSLHTAVLYKDRVMTTLLLAHPGIHVNAVDKHGDSPLFDCVRASYNLEEDVDILEQLLEHGADPSHTCKLGDTLLHRAVALSNNAFVQFFMKLGLSVTAKNSAYNTPLHCATDFDIIVSLVHAGACVNAKNKSMETILHCAARSEELDLRSLEFLLQRVTDINARDIFGCTPLFYTLDVHCFRSLLSAGARVNTQTNDGETVLHRMTRCGETDEIISIAIEWGAHVNARDVNGCTPLFFTTELSTLRLLLDAGASVNAQTNAGDTVLHRLAYGKEDLELFHFLVERGVDVNITNSEGKTALFCACDPEIDIAVPRLLLNAGTRVNEKCNDGWTALHMACKFGMKELAMDLLRFGANPHARTNSGYTPADVAMLSHSITDANAIDFVDVINTETVRMDRLIAFGMAGHDRLGRGSVASVLFGCKEVFRMVVDPDFLGNNVLSSS
jgi:ankyrin repeat protein